MPKRARMALEGAAVGVALLIAIWYAAHYIGVVKRADASILNGFVQLRRPRLDQITNFVANLCDPQPYVYLAALPVLAAFLRGRPRLAITLGVILLGANETTALLKPLLAAPHDLVPGHRIAQASWPSGHATAAMSLCMCWVMAAPSRLRPVVASVMAAFAIAVSYSFLELSWHYPSDVLGGFLVATVWTLVAIAGLSIYEYHRPELPAERGSSFSLTAALTPPAVLIAGAVMFAALIALARPHEVIEYTQAHTAFVVGATVIGALGISLASGVMLMLRRAP